MVRRLAPFPLVATHGWSGLGSIGQDFQQRVHAMLCMPNWGRGRRSKQYSPNLGFSSMSVRLKFWILCARARGI